MSIFSDAEKRTKRDIHPTKPPLRGRLKQIIAARRRLFLCFGIAGRRDVLLNSLRSRKRGDHHEQMAFTAVIWMLLQTVAASVAVALSRTA